MQIDEPQSVAQETSIPQPTFAMRLLSVELPPSVDEGYPRNFMGTS